MEHFHHPSKAIRFVVIGLEDYRAPFLSNITGALSKELLVRDLDVQVIHGFDSPEHAQAYLTSDLFKNDVAPSLQPLWSAAPDVRIYTVA